MAGTWSITNREQPQKTEKQANAAYALEASICTQRTDTWLVA